MIAELIDVDDPRWRSALGRIPHDVYHLPEYVAAAALHERGSAAAFHAADGDHELLMPILIRPLPHELTAPDTWKDATTPYGYSGPIATAHSSVAQLRASMAAFSELAAQRDIVAAFLRLHPLLGISLDAFVPGTCVRHGSVVAIDLTRPIEVLRAETRRDHRNSIRRLTQAGFVATMNDWSTFDAFKAAYRATMDRVSAVEFYYFSDAYFEKLRDTLGSRLHLCTVRAPNGDVACAGLFTAVQGVVQYHLSGTASTYLSWAPSKLMIDAVRAWASARGDRVMNLGGAPDAQGSLMMFKSGFSRSRADFHTVRIVVDNDRYEQLQATGRKRLAWDVDPDGYFPAYRRGVGENVARGSGGTERVSASMIAPDDPRWERVLQRARHDVYHLPQYSVASARLDGGVPAAYYAEVGESAVLVPLIVRDIPPDLGAPDGWKDAISPYGYAGPLATDGASPDVIGRLLAPFRDIAADRDLVTAFLRLHPLRGVAESALDAVGSVVRHEPIVYIDLTKSHEELAADTRSNHRRNIAKLKRAGFVAEMDRWSEYATFQQIYRMTMQRQAASEFYFFSDEYFDDLRGLLGDRLHLCTVRSPEGAVVAAGVFTTVDGLVEYHLGGTVDEYLSAAPSKLMFDFVRDWAKARGDTTLNLGGGIGASAGPLLHFKAGFSSSRADFHTCRVIVDAERYAKLRQPRLVAVASSHDDAAHENAAPRDFFPAYRAT